MPCQKLRWSSEVLGMQRKGTVQGQNSVRRGTLRLPLAVKSGKDQAMTIGTADRSLGSLCPSLPKGHGPLDSRLMKDWERSRDISRGSW